MPRSRYNRISPTDRSRIVRAANDGGNWRQLAEQLGVNHKTAYTWIREGRDEAKQKGGRRRKCTNEQIDVLVAMIESDPTLTLRQLSERTLPEFGVHVSPSTIHNYLQGKLITLKKGSCYPCHHEHGRQQRTAQTVCSTGQSVHERWKDHYLDG